MAIAALGLPGAHFDGLAALRDFRHLAAATRPPYARST